MKVVPLTLKQANAFIEEHHRHHKPVHGHRFSIGAADDDGQLVAVCCVGRPVSRGCAPYHVAEVTRLASDGSQNACSFLYAAAARTAKAMGFESIQTYTLLSEPGTSLRAAGWRLDGTTKGGDWNVSANKRREYAGPRRTDQPQEPKNRWVKEF